MSSLRKRINAELEALVDRHGRQLKQRHVVEAARLKGSALHEDFERQGLWNDAKAAARARLEYASRLIRTYVVKDTEDGRPPVRALVSIMDDRKTKSGLPGYRPIGDVMRDDGLRANLLATARMELRACRRKYDALTELASVWSAIDAIDAPGMSAKDSSETRATA